MKGSLDWKNKEKDAVLQKDIARKESIEGDILQLTFRNAGGSKKAHRIENNFVGATRYVRVKKNKIKFEEKAEDSETGKNCIRGIIDDPENNIHSSIGETKKRMEKP